MFAVNDAPLRAQVLDPSSWSGEFRDGQKLRQEYDARQQQKALNEIMRTQDHAGRIAQAQQHKYAGALVPLLQKYDEDRQKAALDNLKSSADIGKVFGETGKLNAEVGKVNAESGEIGVKTQNATLDGLVKKYDQISAGALTQNPQYFAVMLGDFQNNGLINPEQKGVIIDMMMKDPQQAAAVMRGIAKGSIEGFKATAPQVQSTNLGDRQGFTSYDNQTGQITGLGDFKINQSPDNAATNATNRANNINTVSGSMYNSDNSLEGTKYVADTNYAGKVYGADSVAKTAGAAQANDWYVKNAQLGINQQNANTATTKAQPVAGANGQVARKLNSTEQKQLFELEDGLNADKAVISSLNSMMGLADKTNSGLAAAGRARGWSNIGMASEKDNNTVLFDNMATEQALKQLKSTFGAAPTEGERKILMDIQASANKTPTQKKAIIQNAMDAAKKRLAHRELLAEGIRTGQYMVPKGNQAQTTQKPANKSSNKQNAKPSAGKSIIEATLGGR